MRSAWNFIFWRLFLWLFDLLKLRRAYIISCYNLFSPELFTEGNQMISSTGRVLSVNISEIKVH